MDIAPSIIPYERWRGGRFHRRSDPLVALQFPLKSRGRTMLSHPSPDESPDARELRGKIFNDLDRLAFALEMESAAMLEQGNSRTAKARQDLRLGVRLAQRLVSGIWADEVNPRIQKHAEAYEARLGRVA